MTGATVAFEEKQRLPDLCAECFMLITQLRVSQNFGDPNLLRRRIKDLFDRWERNARKANVQIENIQTSRFALVIFIDEAIANSSWSQKESWMALPLQLELYGIFTGGNDFFVKLDQLRQRARENIEVLEVYYLCLVLGFKGKYILEPDKLKLLIEDTYNDMRRVAEGRSVEALSPHGQRREEVVAAVGREIPLWVVGTAAAAVAVLLFIIMSILMNNAAGDVEKIIKPMLGA